MISLTHKNRDQDTYTGVDTWDGNEWAGVSTAPVDDIDLSTANVELSAGVTRSNMKGNLQCNRSIWLSVLGKEKTYDLSTEEIFASRQASRNNNRVLSLGRIDNIRSPLLGLRVQQTTLVNLRPDSARSIKSRSSARGLGEVD